MSVDVTGAQRVAMIHIHRGRVSNVDGRWALDIPGRPLIGVDSRVVYGLQGKRLTRVSHVTNKVELTDLGLSTYARFLNTDAVP